MWFAARSLDMDFAAHTPHALTYEVELPDSSDALFALLADAARWPEWFAEMQRVQWLTPAPHGRGSERIAHLDLLSVRERFIAWEPGRRMTFCGLAMSLPLAEALVEDYQLTPIGPGWTRLRWSVHYQLRPIFRPLHRPIRWFFDRMFRAASAALVDYVVRNGRTWCAPSAPQHPAPERLEVRHAVS